MDSTDIIATLAEATLASSAAIVMVLLLRRPLRIRYGAAISYAGWLLVPVALMAILLPAATVTMPVAWMPVTMEVAASQPVAGAAAGFNWVTLGLSAWTVGVLVATACFSLQQRRFRSALGALRERADGLQQAASARGLPAAFGLLWPMIVVPVDFEKRYSAEQRALMHAHERSHIRGGDLHANAFVAALRCVMWFNPLLHLAARHFRHDQELACDQRVIARHPHSRRAYGEAMFKTQLAAQPLPLGCHWGYGHPLKERIEMLKQPVPTRSRRTLGVALVTALALLTGTIAWAAQPARTVASASASVRIAPAADSGSVPPLPPPPPAPPAPPLPSPPPAPPAPPVPPVPVDPQLPAPPPPPPAPTSLPSAPPALRTPPPRYPAAAVEQKVSGMVMLVIDIDAQGHPVDIEVERSEPAGMFDQAAVDAAWQWKFTPEVKTGKPVASRIRVPITFEIPPGEGGAGNVAGVDMTALSQTGSVTEASCGKTAGHIGSEAMVCLDN